MLKLALIAAAIALPVVFFWIARRPVRGLYLAFFGAGILMTPHVPVLREKFALPEVVLLLTWAAMAVNARAWLNRPPLTASQRLSLFLLGGFVFMAVVSFAVNNVVYDARFVGSAVETANLVYVFLIFATTVLLVADWEDWLACVLAWMAGAAVVSLVGAYSVLVSPPGWAVDEFTRRISSTMKFENQVPSYLIPILPAIALLAVTRGVRPALRVGLLGLFVLALLTLAGTGSRTAVAMMPVLFVGLLWAAAREWRSRVYHRRLFVNAAVAAAALVVVYVVFALATYQGNYALGKTPAWQRPVAMLYEWVSGQRALDNTRDKQIAAVAENIDEFSLFGTGPKLAAPRIQSHGEVHNSYLGSLIETGVLGFSLFAAWLIHLAAVGFRSLARCPHARARLLVAALLVGYATLLVYGLFIYGLRQRNLWLMAGLLAALPALLQQQRTGDVAAGRPQSARLDALGTP